MFVIWLGAIVMWPLYLRMTETPQIASATAFFFAAMVGSAESVGFIRRALTWEASTLVPGYCQKVWIVSLGIVGSYIAFVVLLSFAFGNFLPPVGLAVLFAMVSLVTAVYAWRSGNRVDLIYLLAFLLSFFVFIWARWFVNPEFHANLLISVASPFVQIATMVVAAGAAVVLKNEIKRSVLPSKVGIVIETARFRLDVAARFRICGWAHPTTRPALVLIYLIPILVVAGKNLIFSDPASVLSMAVALYVYIGTGTPFGLLKTPGMWFSNAWRFGLGESRQSLGVEFALNIVKASIVPSFIVLSVALIHAMYVESPRTGWPWPGHENFFDEALLLITVNLLFFTWACVSYPRRTTECPEFLHIRIVMCIASCLIFIHGIDFGLVNRVVLLSALTSSALLAIYVGGRRIAEIDFLPIEKQVDPFGR